MDSSYPQIGRVQINGQTYMRPVIRVAVVALDGTSLTINEVTDTGPGGGGGTTFGVNIIPHTQIVTTWGERRAGDQVNLEVDVLARYVARLLATKT